MKKQSGARRWLVLGLVLVAAVMAVGRLARGDATAPTGARVEQYVAGPVGLSEALDAPDAVFRRANPPIDVEQIVRSARSVTLDQVPLPDDREVTTYRRDDTGAEITQIVLLYDDEQAAAELDKLASSLVAGAFHMETEPTTLEGAEDARLWSADGYRAISFRRDGMIVFVGSTDTDTDGIRSVAEKTLAEIIANPPATATAEPDGK